MISLNFPSKMIYACWILLWIFHVYLLCLPVPPYAGRVSEACPADAAGVAGANKWCFLDDGKVATRTGSLYYNEGVYNYVILCTCMYACMYVCA